MLVPTPNDEYFIYQTLLGIWPPGEPDVNEMARFSVRIAEYLVKAVREAKVYTSWINPNTAYEDAILAFADALINAPAGSAFLTDFLPFQRRIARLGIFNSLSQTLIKLTVPGVPDIYQGCEFGISAWWTRITGGRLISATAEPCSMHCRRLPRRHLNNEKQGYARYVTRWKMVRAKLLVVRSALALRERWPEVFQQGSYLPLAVKGEHAAHLCAYARIAGGRTVITVAPRFFARLLGEADMLPLGEKVWGDTTVEMPFHRRDNQYTCAFTGKVLKPEQQLSGWRLPVAQVLAEFPVGLIIGESVQT